MIRFATVARQLHVSRLLRSAPNSNSVLTKPASLALNSTAPKFLPSIVQDGEKNQSLDIHAKPVFLPSQDHNSTALQRLHWIPSEVSEKRRLEALEAVNPASRSPFTSTYLPPECKAPETLPDSITIAPKEINPYYPLPLPPKEMTILTAEDEQRMQEFNATVSSIIPPNDPLQIPLELSKPWFGFALKVYCALLAVVIVLTGDWDRMTNGYPNCFSGIQGAFWAWYNGLWAVDAAEEEKLIRRRFEKALSHAAVVGDAPSNININSTS